MTRPLAAAVALAAVLAACKPEPAKVGTDTADVASDTETLRGASAAVNEVLRLAADCDAAKPVVPEAMAKVDEAARHIRTAAGQATIASLRVQLQGVERNCP